MSSSSDTGFDIAPESPRAIYPEMQARMSDARNSEIRMFPANWWFSSPLKIVHDDDQDEDEDEKEEKEDPSIIRLPPRREHESESKTSESEHPRITKLPPRRDSEPEPETSESDSEHSSRDSEVERPNVSQPRLSDHTLEPSDSISNQDHRSTAGSMPRFAPPSQSISTDNRCVDSRFYESADGAWMKRHVRYPAHPSRPSRGSLRVTRHTEQITAPAQTRQTLWALSAICPSIPHKEPCSATREISSRITRKKRRALDKIAVMITMVVEWTPVQKRTMTTSRSLLHHGAAMWMLTGTDHTHDCRGRELEKEVSRLKDFRRLEVN